MHLVEENQSIFGVKGVRISHQLYKCKKHIISNIILSYQSKFLHFKKEKSSRFGEKGILFYNQLCKSN